jgi:hypothetical protein
MIANYILILISKYCIWKHVYHQGDIELPSWCNGYIICFAPISAVYGILLFQKKHMMSAWQRCMSAIYLRGQLKGTVIIKTPKFWIQQFQPVTTSFNSFNT